MHKSVYLAGRIEGLKWEGAAGWRDWAANILRDANISYHNPCEHIPNELRNGTITAERVAANGGLLGDEIYTQDMFYLKNHTNIFLVNLSNPGRFTMIEWGIAHALDIVIIGFGGENGERDYFPIRKQAYCIFDSIEEAIDFIIAL